MLATVQQQFDLKNGKRNYRKFCVNSILINHKITYDAIPCLPLSAVTVSLHYLPRCLHSTVTYSKMPNIVTLSEFYKICCHFITTQ